MVYTQKSKSGDNKGEIPRVLRRFPWTTCQTRASALLKNIHSQLLFFFVLFRLTEKKLAAIIITR